MNREDKICLVLQGLINGVDYETGEAHDFSDTVIDSLKAVTASLECDKRNQYTIDSKDKLNNSNSVVPSNVDEKYNDWEVVSGKLIEIFNNLKHKYPEHLIIIQCGFYFDIRNEDVQFFLDNFSYSSYEMNGELRTGFPVRSENVLPALRDMKRPFVLVSQLPEKDEKGKTLRAISEIYDG